MMARNRFHRIWLAIALSASIIAPVAISQNPATAAAPVGSAVNLVITFAPGTPKLSAAAKTALSAKVEQMSLAKSVSIVGYSSATTKKSKVASDALARAISVRGYLTALGLTVSTTIKSGGYSSRFLKAAVANRVALSFTPTPGLLWVQDFNESAGSLPSAKYFTGLSGNGCQELGLCNYGTGEKELNDPAAAKTDGAGNLVISTQKYNNVWSSARIWTAQKLAFQYGKLEIRAKMPAGNFNWPAIWMLGNNYAPPNQSFGSTQWPESGELDIAEGLGANSVIQGTIHGLDTQTGGAWRGGGGVTAVAPLAVDQISIDFHTWGIEWQPNQVNFTMDGSVYASDTFDGSQVTQVLGNGGRQVFDSRGNWPFNQPFFLILNNAVWGGASAPNGAWSEFKIDYIRYSTLNGYGTLTR